MDGTAKVLARARKRGAKRRQSGQAIVEYLLLTMLVIGFARFIFFSNDYGIYGLLNKGMLRLGSALEQNLKSGTQSGSSQNAGSTDPFGGIGAWNN